MSTTSTYNEHFFLAGKNLAFRNLFENISNNSVVNTEKSIESQMDYSKKTFNLTRNIVWVCKKCGHTHIGVNSPGACPICNSGYEINNI